VQSEEAIYYVDGQFGSRRGVDVGMITLHPSGLPHGPQPGLVEASLGVRRTEELAVMWDTFKPLRLTELSRACDRPEYALSWSREAAPAGIGG
jgi:homogentisate 1,2-dioxygenase